MGDRPFTFPRFDGKTTGADYATLGLEAQAQVISDWFAGTNTHGATGQTKPRDVNSPYFGDVQAMRNGHF